MDVACRILTDVIVEEQNIFTFRGDQSMAPIATCDWLDADPTSVDSDVRSTSPFAKVSGIGK